MTPELKQRIEQIQQGIVPEECEIHKGRVFPKGWYSCQVQDVATVSSGSTPNRANPEYWNGSIPWVTTGELEAGLVFETKEHISEKALANTSLRIYPDNTILMAMYGQGKTRGTVALLKTQATINQACAAINPINGFSTYLFYYLQNSYNRIRRLSNIGNQENLNADIVKTYPILWPPLAEQQKIAAILTTHDKVIELKEKRLAEKQRQKKYLMQQLLTGKKRLPGFGGVQHEIRLKEIARHIRRRNSINNGNVLTISAQFGLINQSEFFNKEIASEDKSNYFLLHRDEFAYNKSSSAGYPYGAIKRLVRYDAGVVSPLYICFSIDSDSVSLEYMEHYFEAGLMNREIQAFAQEGARNHGLLNIAVEDFFNSKILLPSYDEQCAIAERLTMLSREIELLQQDVDQEQQKKKALMQLLLTGIVRVQA